MVLPLKNSPARLRWPLELSAFARKFDPHLLVKHRNTYLMSRRRSVDLGTISPSLVSTIRMWSLASHPNGTNRGISSTPSLCRRTIALASVYSGVCLVGLHCGLC